MANAALKADARETKSAQQVLDSPAFKHLVARRWRMSMILLTLLFISYYGYVLVVAGAKEFVSQKVGEVVTLGIPLGVGVIVFSFILTAIYVGWANRSYDPEVDRIKGELKR
jgi:uncharacterized membrane protein (DUF485 family)